MRKLGFAALIATLLTTLTVVGLSGSADAGTPCKSKKLESKMLQEACKAGGQKAAKDAMKKWMKTAKKKEASVACASCHTKVGGDYPKKDDAWDHYVKLGGQ